MFWKVEMGLQDFTKFTQQRQYYIKLPVPRHLPNIPIHQVVEEATYTTRTYYRYGNW